MADDDPFDRAKLPSGWKKYHSNEHGRDFYYNKELDQTSWTVEGARDGGESAPSNHDGVNGSVQPPQFHRTTSAPPTKREGNKVTEIEASADEVWSENELLQMKVLKNKCERKALLYGLCNDHYHTKYYRYQVPVMMLTAIVTLLAAVWPEEYYPLRKTLMVSCLSGLASLLTGLLSLFKYAEKAAYFEIAACTAKQLRERCSYALKTGAQKEKREQIKEEMQQKMTELEGNPLIVPPQYLQEKFEKGRRAGCCCKADTRLRDITADAKELDEKLDQMFTHEFEPSKAIV